MMFLPTETDQVRVKIAAIVAGWDEPMRVDRVVNDDETADGRWFYGYVENSFDPYPRVLVHVDAWESDGDAFDWLLCDEGIERDCAVETDGYFVRDYSYGELALADIAARWDARWIQGQGLVPPYDPDNADDASDMARVVEHCGESGRLTWNDNGTMLDTESVMLSECQPTIVFEDQYGIRLTAPLPSPTTREMSA